MKRLFFLIAITGYAICAFAQSPLSETEKLTTLCQVWGLLKYHHPAVAKGKYNWDEQLITKLATLPSISTRQELCAMYTQWINELGTLKKGKYETNTLPPSSKLNLNIAWIHDSTYFSDSLSILLDNILAQKHKRKNYYARRNLDKKYIFTHEKKYADTVFPSAELRLLSLFRYWNAINYYYPCRFANEEDWNTSLTRLIPLFTGAENVTQYCMAMSAMIAKINDSHAEFFTPPVFSHISKYRMPPFRYMPIGDRAVVIGPFNDSLARLDDIAFGDVIESVDGVSIPDIKKYKSQYVSSSSEKAKLTRLHILADTSDSASVILERDGVKMTKVIHRYRYDDFHYQRQPYNPLTNSDSLLYINLYFITPKQIRHLRHEIKNKTAVIIDARLGGNNGSKKIARKFLSKKHEFVRFSSIHPRHPGITLATETHMAGRKNNRYFKGKVVLLFGAETQSAGEYACMMLRKAPDVISIGENTAAADGPVSYLNLPGGYRTRFSAKGVYEPDGRSLVRIGLTPDVEVTQTIEGIKMHKDEVLERAIECINKEHIN